MTGLSGAEWSPEVDHSSGPAKDFLQALEAGQALLEEVRAIIRQKRQPRQKVAELQAIAHNIQANQEEVARLRTNLLKSRGKI